MAKGVVCLEDGTLAWYDQGTEGIAHCIIYLRFIPPSPKDEAGQDRRKISINFPYLIANRRQVCSHPLQSGQLRWHTFNKRFINYSPNWVFIQFQPCWAWIPFTVFPDQNLSSYCHNFSFGCHLKYLHVPNKPLRRCCNIPEWSTFWRN